MNNQKCVDAKDGRCRGKISMWLGNERTLETIKEVEVPLCTRHARIRDEMEVYRENTEGGGDYDD